MDTKKREDRGEPRIDEIYADGHGSEMLSLNCQKKRKKGGYSALSRVDSRLCL
jgi:hypothetical protein